MTKLYKPIIKPPSGRGYEGADPWETIPTYAPYEFSFIQLKEFPHSYFWTWGVFAWLQGVGLDILTELQADGWEPWRDETRESHFWAHNQGAQVLMVEERAPEYQMRDWLRTNDLRHAQQFPVALSHESKAKDYPAWIPPDLAIGSCALVKDGEDSRVYRIEQLGEEAKRMQARLQQGLVLYTADEDPEWADVRRTHYRHRLEQWEEVHDAAQRLAEFYWQFHMLIRPPAPTIVNLFEQGGSIAIPANVVVRGALAAFSNAQSGAGQWKQEDGLPFYEYRQGKDTALVQYQPAQAFTLSRDTLLAQIRSLGDLDGDVLLALVAQWCAAEHDEEGYCWISSERMLNYRSLQPRRYVAADGQEHLYQHRFEDLKLIEQAMAHIRDTFVTVQQWTKAEQEGKRKRGRPRKEYLALRGYLIQIDQFLTHGLLFDEGTNELTPQEVQVAWQFKPGTSLAPFLQDVSPHFAALLQISLSFDPKKEWWEKRLSRFLLFHMYLGGPHSGTWRIRDIFADLHFPEKGDKPDRIRSHFEKALDRLKEKHPKFPHAAPLLAGWSYEEDLNILPAKKWLSPWLDCHVHLHIGPHVVTGSLVPEAQKEKKTL